MKKGMKVEMTWKKFGEVEKDILDILSKNFAEWTIMSTSQNLEVRQPESKSAFEIAIYIKKLLQKRKGDKE